ncbi:hypothetical protein [Myroides odoratimimus]|uniref:hypothetical protein n=1 Tax=Myroides odoratimimus TaxID=76832 RepID=UPI002DB633E7|nr:hypothetical protein [Myroides odoratimimus]MEC4028776.1 hypothetical protein [Myroides odoratimimus]
MIKRNIILLGLLSGVFTSCVGVKPITSEYEIFYERSKGIVESELGNGRVLFYNGGYFIPDYTPMLATMVNLKLNGKSAPITELGEFFILRLDYGEYEIETEVRDVFWKRSKYKVEITADTKVINIIGGGIGKNVKVVDKLPNPFDNYRYVKMSAFKSEGLR